MNSYKCPFCLHNFWKFEIAMRKFYVPLVSLLTLDVMKVMNLRNSIRCTCINTCYHLEELIHTTFPISLGKIVKLRLNRNNFALWTSYWNFCRLLITKTFIYLTVFLCICICLTLDLYSPFLRIRYRKLPSTRQVFEVKGMGFRSVWSDLYHSYVRSC